ncbi:MAG: hypothetical protein A3I75_07000 [Deltaproteobacteria bacterium RIFCSPLOWO2_02_FULL_50_16]|nr:MAG: hypothetical protein A2053_00620 [Deltaproteobacteria bacterium GWA2_50_8]OGQ26991.1 MAG: hypothetical protein A3B79_03265 [Deltaproteobacteria bacterium RIFCSPHIGHO2_02_FULL_50_15]OGQ56470.1 MAG: hypothetical protein A3I75_07000 [Deltaproteobacteria bacterium RIFCSPLOWO2_02_FULL_50_16]OGQ68926.1 MAG: hypothetical protein A3F89_02770 [Deltaproteobacteria bacterium RIFCSPLOWO2_12_FULL_50_11]
MADKKKNPPGNESIEDPYLDQLESSMEDLNLEDPTRADVPVSSQKASKPPVSQQPQNKPRTPPAPSAPPVQATDFSQISPDIPVNLVAVIGKRHMTVKDLLELQMGEVVELDRAPHDVVDLVANGKLVAQGELVEIQGKLGVRILRMV